MLCHSRVLLATTAAVAVVVLSGCGQTVVAAAGPSPADTSVPEIPVVEAYCSAEYHWYEDATELVSRADEVVRVTATGPSRSYQVFPDDPPGEPLAGISATAITVRVTQVLKGDLAVGDVVEVQQGMCTDRPLPAGLGTDYVLALSGRSDERLFGQLNEDQAAWQVDATGGLHPVSPRNDLRVSSLEELALAATAATPWTPRL